MPHTLGTIWIKGEAQDGQWEVGKQYVEVLAEDGEMVLCISIRDLLALSDRIRSDQQIVKPESDA